MLSPNLRRRIHWLLDFEPSWFAEFGSGVAIWWWSVSVCLTRNVLVQGDAWIMPIIGVFFGPLRLVMLMRLHYPARVTLAALGALWWGWLIVGGIDHRGWFPGIGPLGSLLLQDVLTLARFSIPCAQELVDDWRRAHVAKR